MNVQLPVHLDKTAFLAWLEGREERYELVDGRVVMMVNASRAHALIVSNLIILLHGQLDRRSWAVFTEFGVDAGPRTLRFPDIMVDRAGGSLNDRTATEPALMIEVLSPSTARLDLGDKAAEFLRLPQLAGYVVFAQDQRKAWAWVRSATGLPPAPEVIEGDNATVEIAGLGVRLPLSRVYAHVELE